MGYRAIGSAARSSSGTASQGRNKAFPGHGEPDRLIQAASGIGVDNVKERLGALRTDAAHDRLNEPSPEPRAAVGRVGTDGADLDPPRRCEATAGHRGERAPAANADVAAEGDGVGKKWTGLGASSELEHLRYVGDAEDLDLRVRFPTDGLYTCHLQNI
jgi:hypothetical protein